MSGTRQVVLLLAVAVAGLAAACGAATLGPRDDGAAVTALSDTFTAPQPRTETRAGEPVTVTVEGSTQQESVTEAAAPPPAGVSEGLVYFIRYDRFDPDVIGFAATDDPARKSLDALLAGPSPAERSLRYWSEIPTGTRVRSLTVDEGTAAVDLSGEFRAVTSAPETTALGRSDLVALYQIVYTLTARPEVRRVTLSIDGVPYDPNFGQPLTREAVDFLLQSVPSDDFELSCQPSQQPLPEGAQPFVLGAPADGTKIPRGGTIQISGIMRLPDASLVVRVLQYRTEVRHAISQAGCDGTFTATLRLPATLTGPITLEAYVPSDEGTKRYQRLRDLMVE